MQRIIDILNYPDGTPIDAIQGNISEVYAYEKKTGAKGPYTLQKAIISDVGFNKIRLTVWDHPDLTPLRGNEYVLHNTGGTRYPGIKVRHGSYVAKKDGQDHKIGDTVKTIELSVTKNGCFQHIEVYNQSKPATSAPAEPVSRPATAQSGPIHGKGCELPAPAVHINGAKVGMAINCATQLLVASSEAHGGFPGQNEIIEKIDWMASQIITLSNRLETGKLHQKTVAKADSKPVSPPSDEILEDQVPF